MDYDDIMADDDELFAEDLDLLVEECWYTWTVNDQCGGRWWPGPPALRVLKRLNHPEIAVLRLCLEPGMGESRC